jgi:hypothetical protein
MTSLNMVSVTATSSGLTIATTAYTADDTLGALMSFNVTVAKGLILGAVITDESDIIGAVDCFLFDRTLTFGTDNAAPSIADADMIFSLGVISFPYPYDLGGTRMASVDSIAIPYAANSGTTIYGGLVTRSGHTFFSSGGADSLNVRLLVSTDS